MTRVCQGGLDLIALVSKPYGENKNSTVYQNTRKKNKLTKELSTIQNRIKILHNELLIFQCWNLDCI